MKVIPAVDVKNGLVVWAKMGLRESYKPLESWLCPSSNLLMLIKNLKEVGFKEVYLADLDAISGKPKNFKLYNELSNLTNLILDCGVKNLNEIEECLNCGVFKVVLATEVMPNLDLPREAIKKFGLKNIILSLDLKDGSVLSFLKELSSLNPLECLKFFSKIGFKECLIIDVSRVGSFKGLDLGFLEKVKKETSLKVFAGGGVRSLEDILSLKRIGVDGVLIASALHEKLISLNELKKYGFL
ncbi:MAG: HisA/HisF-related TIM barrel protein [Candidatus Bathyarchaeia archaeon]